MRTVSPSMLPGLAGQHLDEVLYGDLLAPLDGGLGPHLDPLARHLDHPAVGQAGVVDVAEDGIEAGLLAVPRPKVDSQAVDAEDADAP